MIRFDPAAPATVWRTVKVALDDKPQEMRVQFRVFEHEEAVDHIREQLEGAQAADDGGKFEALLDSMTQEKVAGRRQQLAERIVDWDLLSEPKIKLPVTPENVGAVLRTAVYFRPLWNALIEASQGATEKN